jgi:hypothetical protein
VDDTASVLAFLMLWVVISGAIGSAVGGRRDNSTIGLFLGIFLGPIGWIIAAILDYPEKCAVCGGGIPKNVAICKHCGSIVAHRDQEPYHFGKAKPVTPPALPPEVRIPFQKTPCP